MIDLICLIIVLTPVYTPETLPSDAGVYDVSITYENQLVTRSKITVTTDSTTQSPIDQKIYLDAQDFYITDVSSINSNSLIERSNVRIWNAETGEYYDIEDVTYSRVTDSLYMVNFYQSADVFITVRMYVVTDEEYQNTVLPKEYGQFSWEQPILEKDNSGFSVNKTIRFILYTLSSIHIIMIVLIVLSARGLVKRNVENLELFDDSLKNVSK